MIEYSILQIGCMLIVIYIAFIYFRERYAYKVQKKEIVFELLLLREYSALPFAVNMDRINAVYIYDGKDTWTDESGVEWNKTVK